jgi:hypothetical protein
MKAATDKGKPSNWALDLRVRERLVLVGQLDPKVVERHLAELPDLEGHAETIPIQQPALGGSDDDDDGIGP